MVLFLVALPNFDFFILGGADEGVTIAAENEIGDDFGVAGEGLDGVAGVNVPEFNTPVFWPGGDDFSVGMKGEGTEGFEMAFEFTDNLTVSDVEEFGGFVHVAGDGEALTVGADGDGVGPNGFWGEVI